MVQAHVEGIDTKKYSWYDANRSFGAHISFPVYQPVASRKGDL